MTRSPAGRSGRPTGAAGLLASLVLATATTVGLGCAAAGGSTSGAAVELGPATNPTIEQGAPSAIRLAALELRPRPVTPRAPQPAVSRDRPVAEKATRLTTPSTTVVDAGLKVAS
ncbi:MAG TPA: hypothetical protein VFU98_02045, partial [Microlunatus sp.]|nr:hypothetical protein [Microlunatus sp.]